MRYQLKESRSPFPALNDATFEAATAMLSPVCGFRPCRAARSFTEKVPNPVMRTDSSPCKGLGNSGERGVEEIRRAGVRELGLRRKAGDEFRLRHV